MGYRVPRRELELTFEGTDFDGAVIRCRLDISLETLFEFERIAGADVESARAVYEKFADEVLVSWNLEQDDGTPVPASAAGLMAQPPVFCTAVLDAWKRAVSEPSAPLVSPSAGGDGSVVPLAKTGT